MQCTYRRSWEADTLLWTHPPRVADPNKQLVLELGRHAPLRGSIEVTRWAAAALPGAWRASRSAVRAGHYTYEGQPGTWHVNFADPDLFFGYGTSLFAQDELQCAEHPALGCVREAMLAEGVPALTAERGVATPVLVRGVERRVAIDTSRVYGNTFAAASLQTIREVTTVLDPPVVSNILAIAAPVGGGMYRRAQIEYAMVAAYTGFAAAAHETPGAMIRTGFWGCGAFGGNRELMVAIQLAAARYAGVDVEFYAFDDAGTRAFEAGARVAAELAADSAVEALVARGYRWGVSNGT